MNYKVAGNTPNIRPGFWNRDYALAKHTLLQGMIWQRAGLFFVLGLLLTLVVLECTRSSSPIISVVLIAALFVAAFAMRRPDFALLLVFAGAGLPSIVLPLSFHSMHLIEPAIGLCLLIIILRRPYMRLRLPHLFALLFIGIGIISFINIPTFATNLNAYESYKELYSLVLYIIAFFIGTFLVDYIKNISSFLVVVLLSNIPLYLISLAQALGIHVSSFLEDSGAQDPLQSGGRLWGTFTGAATFGSYLVVLLAIALACWLLGSRRRDRIIGVVMTLATLLVIVGSGTRSAAIAGVAIVILAFVVTRRYKLLLGTLVSTGILTGIFLGKILPRFTHANSSTSNRLFLWQFALQIIQAHPWLGIGLEQFPIYYARLIVGRDTQLNPDGVSPHNQYLAWALSSGILWPIVAVALLISIIYFCGRAYRIAQGGQQIILLAAILAVVADLIVSFVDVPLEKTEGAVFLFLLAGLALGYAEHIRWGRSTAAITHSHTSATSVRAVSPTGLDNAVYIPASTRKQRHAAVPSVTSGTTTDTIEVQEETPTAQKAGRSVILQLLSWGFSAVIIFPATALLTRYLGPVQYGEYSYTIPFLAIFALLSGTGMDPLITRSLSTQKRSLWSDTLSYAAGTRLFTTIIVSGGAALTAILLPVSTEQRILLLLGSGCLLFSFSFNGLRTVYECGFWAEQRFAVPSLIEAIDRVLTSGLIVVAILFHFSLPWTYILIVYSDLPFTLALVIIARRRFHMGIRFSLVRVREYLIASLSLTIHNALTLFTNQANLLFLLPLAGSLSVGIYALAFRIISPLSSIAIVYVIGLYALLCKRFEEGREQFSVIYSETTRIIALTVIPLAILVSLEASTIVVLLGGPRFAASATVTQVLMWAVVATFFSQLAVRSCMAAHLERSIPYVTGTSLVVNVLSNLLLIPHWQAVGAATAALLSQLVAFLLFSLLLARHVNLLRTSGVVLRVVLGNAPATAFLFWQPHLPVLLLIPIFAFLVIVGCIVTRTLSMKDVSMMRHMLLTRKNRASSEMSDAISQTTAVLPNSYDVT